MNHVVKSKTWLIMNRTRTICASRSLFHRRKSLMSSGSSDKAGISVLFSTFLTQMRWMSVTKSHKQSVWRGSSERCIFDVSNYFLLRCRIRSLGGRAKFSGAVAGVSEDGPSASAANDVNTSETLPLANWIRSPNRRPNGRLGKCNCFLRKHLAWKRGRCLCFGPPCHLHRPLTTHRLRERPSCYTGRVSATLNTSPPN